MRILMTLVLLGSVFCFESPQALAGPMDRETFDDFEGIDTGIGESFSIGTATFSGDGFSGVAGIGELYHSGNHAWMINPEGAGTITFGTLASEVEFFGRSRSNADGVTQVMAFDDLDQQIGSTVVFSDTEFELISFRGRIARIEIDNLATALGGDRQMNSIDDFGFTAVPEPTTIGLFATGILVLVGGRRRRRNRSLLPSRRDYSLTSN